MQVLDLPKFRKELVHVILLGLLVDPRHNHDPPFHRCTQDSTATITRNSPSQPLARPPSL